MPNNQIIELIKYIIFTYLLGFGIYSLFFKKVLRENNLYINLALSWGLGISSILFILYLLTFNQALGFVTTSNLNLSVSFLLIVIVINLILNRDKIFSKVNVANWISLIIIIFILKALVIDSLISYLIGFDSIAMWFLKAKSFMHSPGIWNNSFFTTSGFEYTNKAYPIGFPLLIAGFFRLINFANDQIIQLYLLLFFINIVFFGFGFVRKILNNLSVFSHLLISISIFFLPIFMIYSHNGYADMAISFIFTSCIGLFIISQKCKDKFSYQLLGMIISLAGILIKNEAIPFFLVFNVTFLLMSFRQINIKRLGKILTLLIVISIPIILWEIFKRQYQLAFYLDNATIISPLLKIKTISFHFMDEFIRTSYYSLTSIVVLLLIIIQSTYLVVKRRFVSLIPLAIVVAMFMAYGYVYLITTVPLEAQLTSSFERLFLHLLPSMYLVTIYQFTSIFEDLGE